MTTSVMFGVLTALGFGGVVVAMEAAGEGGVVWALLMARLTSVTLFAGVHLASQAALQIGPGEVPRSR